MSFFTVSALLWYTLLFLQILVSVFFQIYSYLGFQPRWEREKELTSFRSSLKITQLALLRNKKFLRVLALHGVDVRLNLVSLSIQGPLWGEVGWSSRSLQYLGHLMRRADSLKKTLDAGKD